MRTRQLILLAALALLAAPSGAAAAWGPVQDLGPLGAGARFAYDGNAAGDRILVWDAGSGFVFARARPGEALGPPRALPDDPRHVEFAPTVELDERGNALLVWTYHDATAYVEDRGGQGYDCCNGLRARVIRADGSVTAARTLAPHGHVVTLADMQIGPGDRVGVVFHVREDFEPVRTMEARLGTVARGLGGREPITRAPVDAPASLAFVRGRARLTYATSTGFGYDNEPVVFREVERVERGRYRRLRSPGNGELVRSSIRFATAPSGEQAVTWLSVVGRTNAVHAGTRRPGEPLVAHHLAAASASPHAPVAIEPRGTALAAWASARPAGVLASLRRSPFGFRLPTAMSAYDDPPRLDAPAVDVNTRGHGLLAWAERPPSRPPRLVGVFRNARGTPLEHHVIEPSGGPFAFAQVAASLDRDGRGYVAYATGDTLRVIAARIGG